MSTLEAMLAQYDKNSKPTYEKKENTYDLKNYFTTWIPDNVKSETKTVRLLPVDGTPFKEVYLHEGVIDGEKKKFPCLKHLNNEPCPFCEAREELLATGEEDKKKIANKYKARLSYVVKVIDRDKEEDGVKFWRFYHDYSRQGVYDKFFSMISALKKDITHVETGRDVVLTISRNQNGIPIISGMQALDPTPLSENAELSKQWLSDTRTWQDVYSTKNYQFLEIVVNGFTPVWDKEKECFVPKEIKEKEDKLESSAKNEIYIGLESKKNQLTSQTFSQDSEEEDDDLPF